MKYFIQIISLIFYILLALILALFIIVQGAILWISSDGGSKWVKTNIENVLQDSGYEVAIGNLDLALLGFKVSNLDIVENKEAGLNLTAENIAVRLNPFPLTMKILNVTFKADKIALNELPSNKKDNSIVKNTDFQIPDIFFDEINVSVIVKEIILPNEDAPIFGVDIRQSINQTDDGEIAIEGNIDIAVQSMPMAPKSIVNKIAISNGVVNIATLNLLHEKYDLSVKGSFDWINNYARVQLLGETNLALDYGIEDLKPLSIVADLSGPTNDLNGDVTANSLYKGNTLNLTAVLNVTDNFLSLQNIDGISSDIAVSGDLMLPYETSLLEGELRVTSEKISNIAEMLNSPIDTYGKANINVKLSADQGGQAINAEGKFTDLEANDISIKTLSMQSYDNNIYDKNWPDLNMVALNIKQNETYIDYAKAMVTPNQNGKYTIDLIADGRNVKPFSINANAIILNTSPLSVDIEKAKLSLENGAVNLVGKLNPQLLDVSIMGKNINPNNVPFVNISNLPVTLDDFKVVLSQTPDKPTINGDYTLTANTNDAPQVLIKGTLNYKNNLAVINANGTGEGIQNLQGSAEIPLEFSISPFKFAYLNNGNIKGKGIAALDLQSVMPYVVGQSYKIGGELKTNVTLDGQMDNLKYSGEGQVTKGSLYDPISDLTLKDMNGSFTFDNDAIVIQNLISTGEDEKGSLVIDGRIGIANMASPDFDLNINAKDMHILNGPPYDVWLNADIDLKTNASEYLLSGDLSLGKVIILLPENTPDPIPQLNIVEAKRNDDTSILDRMKLDLQFVADNKIFIRGYGVDTEMAGNLSVTGYAYDPQVNGDLTSIRGRYEDFGRQFTLEQAILRFQGSVPPSPYLDIISSVRVDDVLAKVNIQGTPRDPSVTFSSQPAMPDDEVLSHILFGEDISTISPFQAIQLANTLRRLSGKGGGGLNVLGSLRNATGLDDIRIEGSGSDARIGAGKYITDKVYLDVAKGAGDDSGSARVEVEITPSISMESEVGQSGENDTNILWRWDY